MKKMKERKGKSIAIIIAVLMMFQYTFAGAMSVNAAAYEAYGTAAAEQTAGAAAELQKEEAKADGSAAADDASKADGSAEPAGSAADPPAAEKAEQAAAENTDGQAAEESDDQAAAGTEAQAAQGEQAGNSGQEGAVKKSSSKSLLAEADEPSAEEMKGKNLTVHVTNIFWTIKSSVNGKAVAFESTQTFTKGQSKTMTAAAVMNWAGGKNNKAAAEGADYTFLNGYVLTSPGAGPVVGSSAADFNFITKVQYKGDGNTVLTFADGTTMTKETIDLYISPAYSAVYPWFLDFRYIDRVSTGSGSWANKDRVTSFSHTFKDPSIATPVEHYSFEGWLDPETDEVYQAGDKYTTKGEGISSGETKQVRIYAMWQPSVTIRYIENGEVTKTEESFDKVSAYGYVPEDTEENITFAGWFDKDGNKIAEDTVYNAPEVTGADEEVTEPLVVDAYAKYHTAYTAKVVWDDENNKAGKRAEAVEAVIMADGEETDINVQLSEENDWTYAFEGLDAYGKDGAKIVYSIDEKAVPEGYTKDIDGESEKYTGIIINTMIPEEEVTEDTEPAAVPDDNGNDPKDSEKTEKQISGGEKIEVIGDDDERSIPAANTADTNEADSATMIADGQTPLAAPAQTSGAAETTGAIIEDGQAPLAAHGAHGAWALINLIAMIVTAVISIGTALFGFFAGRDDEEKGEKTDRKFKARVMGLVTAMISVIAFILTEDMSLPMQLTDRWTILMVIILAVEALCMVLAKKTKEEEEEQEA